jgi:hypothetical protein
MFNRRKIHSADEYRRMARSKLLADHHETLIKILELIHKKIEKEAKNGRNSCIVSFFSPLHYTDSTSREIFNVVSLDVSYLHINTYAYYKSIW